ncbi:MAG TPA: ABC transporter substrate-binding protein [Acidimicrobiales bacterium]
MSERSRLSRAAIAVLLAASVVAGACGGDGSDPAGSDPAEELDPVEAAERSAELRFGHAYGYNSLDPHRTSNPLGDALWLRPVYDRLLTLERGPEGEAQLAPQLATSYEVADDGLSIALTLRDDVTFQDGTPFDAEAVRANLERAQGPESSVASTLASLERVEVVDDTHVVLHLREPDPSVLWAMAVGTTGMMISPAAFEGNLEAEPVGSGPFRLVETARDADTVYERWDGHWDPDAALVARFTVSSVPDGNARYNGLRSGEFDAVYLTSPHDYQARELEPEGYHYRRQVGASSYGVLLDAEEPPVDDVRVRRAISLAINREEISEELLHGVNDPAVQPFNEGYMGYDESIEVPYDPDEARRLVEEAGADGSTIRLIQQMTPPQDTLAEVVQQALGDIGIEVELEPLSSTEARPAWRAGGYHGMVAPIIGQAEPSQTLALSYLGGDNPAPPPEELVAMADEARRLPVDSDERRAAYQEIGAWLAENPVHVPIVQFSTVVVGRPNVVGIDNMLPLDIANLEFRGVGLTES